MDRTGQIVSLDDFRPMDTLSLKARFVIEELRRVDRGLEPMHVEGEVRGLDEAIAECGEACRAALNKEPRLLP